MPPLTDDAQRVEALIQEILQQFRSGDAAGSLQAVQQAIDAHPHHADLYHVASKILEAQGEDGASLEMLENAARQSDANPRYLLELSEKLIKAERLNEAETPCAAYIERAPQQAAGYAALAKVHDLQGHAERAVDVLHKAVESVEGKEEKITLLNDLGVLFRRLERTPEAIETFERALEIHPHVAPVLYNLANAFMDEGEVKRAIRSYQRALDIDNARAEAHLHLGFAFLLEGNLRRGWREMEWRWDIPLFANTMLATPRWKGERTDGAVLLLSEQGMGDSVHFARYAKQVAERAGKVIIYCPPALARLMGTAPGVDEVHTWDTPVPEHESWVPMMSLPGVFKTELHNIPAEVPYLSAIDDDVKAWAEKLQHLKRPRIGLSWKGNPRNERERTRAIDTRAVVEMIDGCNADFVCLHKDRPDDIAAWPENLHHFGDDFGDVADAAALMENLDLVLSIDTLATHLAGAMNKDLWILLAPVADWRYLLDREDSPWYPSARILRRTREEDWSAFMARVAQELKKRFPDV